MLAVFLPKLASAHPHAWIDLESAPIFNDKGEIVGIWQGWLFDDFYSAFILEELSKEAGGKYPQQDITDLAKYNLEALGEYNYFTEVSMNEKRISPKPVTSYKSFMKGNRLWMEFELMLEKPVAPGADGFKYLVYDPGYYVEVLHVKSEKPVSFQGVKQANCTYSLAEPAPPREMSMMALALDKDEQAEDGLGRYFAEQVFIACE